MNIEMLIKEVLNSDVTAYRIAKETGIAQPVITRLRNGERDISKISVETAQKIIDYRNRIL